MLKIVIFLIFTYNCYSLENKLDSWFHVKSFIVQWFPDNATETTANIITDNPKMTSLALSLTSRKQSFRSNLGNSNSHCLFKGVVIEGSKEVPSSPVRIKFCGNKLSGMILLNGVVFVLHTTTNGSWIIFEGDQYQIHHGKELHCGLADIETPKAEIRGSKLGPQKTVNDVLRPKRSTYQERSYVEMIIFLSHDYYLTHGSAAIDRAVEIVHLADFYYASIADINLHLVPVDVVVWTNKDDDPTYNVTDDQDPDDVYDAFADWHLANVNNLKNHDNAALLVSRDFNPRKDGVNAIGLASVGTICQRYKSTSWNWDRPSDSTGMKIVNTLAHELGHNFGLGHNPTDPSDPCYCQETSGCIMDPSLGFGGFTDCQQNNIRNILQYGNSECLHNEPDQDLLKPFCGDYLVNQAWEECDCGGEETCEDPCCHASNCTLVEGAVCSSMDLCCDKSTCAAKPASESCRLAANVCDVTDFCDGVNSKCPLDSSEINGIECSIDSEFGRCFGGNCITIHEQCSLLFEMTWQMDSMTREDCWTQNRRGDNLGHCGRSNSTNSTYNACESSNEKCGKLFCSSFFLQDSFPEQKLDVSTYRLSVSVFECFGIETYFLPSDASFDVSMVRDGTPCADDSICFSQECRKIDEVVTKTCTHNEHCNTNGVCNSSTFRCDCSQNFTGVFCDKSVNEVGEAPDGEDDSSGVSESAIVVLSVLGGGVLVVVVLAVLCLAVKISANC